MQGLAKLARDCDTGQFRAAQGLGTQAGRAKTPLFGDMHLTDRRDPGADPRPDADVFEDLAGRGRERDAALIVA